MVFFFLLIKERTGLNDQYCKERIRIWWWISKEKIIADYLEVIQNGFSSYNSKQDDLER